MIADTAVNVHRWLVLAATLSALPVGVATADTQADLDALGAPLGIPTLSFTLDEPTNPQAGSAGADAPAPEPARATGYGLAGSRWWTVGGAYANDFEDANDFNIHGAFSQFLGDELEFAVEVAGWYFDQPGKNAAGVSGSMVFRWHFLHAEDYNWTLFGDAGIGLLVGFDEVPDEGTSFNFLPRLGLGFSKSLSPSVDGESRGPRLMVGLRWHHVSNARINGDSSNPARDALMGYVAITFPF